MGVLDIPTHRLMIGEACAHHELHAEDYEYDEHELEQAHANERPRKQRTPRLGRKHYGHHEVKKGRGVRRKRRNENFYFLCSLLDGLDADEIPDDNDFSMTTFGELFIDPAKMKAWAEFVNLTEEDQDHFLQSTQKVQQAADNKKSIDQVIDNPEFKRIEQNIRNHLRSAQLSKDSLADYKEDLVFTFSECLVDSLVLDIPSSFERMIVHGLCQYMQLHAQTHKVKQKCLMEIENGCREFSPPTQLLSQYLETFSK